MQTLDKQVKGSQVRVLEIRSNDAFGEHDISVTRRLKELGFLPGAVLTVIGFGFMGADPLAVKLGNTKFALRKQEAQKVLVEAA